MHKLLLASSALLALGIGLAQAQSTNTTSNGDGLAVGVSNVPVSVALDGSTSNAATNGSNAGNTLASNGGSVGDTSVLKDSDNRTNASTALGLNDNAVTNGSLFNVNSDNHVDVSSTLSSARAGGSLDSYGTNAGSAAPFGGAYFGSRVDGNEVNGNIGIVTSASNTGILQQNMAVSAVGFNAAGSSTGH
ncbi:hypothetical protein [Acidocella sp.]|jgi:hypothetical protein|uniref:hypothetical protein n=1 Tax=Acidocella sp. TaxID=50710 RepID=UPI002F421606